jgi:drug/metabolite transporter (DMT)-like permease
MTSTTPETPPPTPRPLLVLASGAVCISFAPILVKAAGNGGMGPTSIGLWRCVVGSVVLLALASILEGRRVVSSGVVRWGALAGLAFFVDLFCWHRSIIHAGAGMATILGNTQVFATALISVLVFHERLGRRVVTAAGAAIVGVALLVGVGSDVRFDRSYVIGIAYGLLTGLLYAVFLLILKKAGRGTARGAPLSLMAWTSVFASLFLGAASLAEGERIVPGSTITWVWLILLGVLPQSIGWWAISDTLPRVPGAVAGLVLLLQPVLATVWGVLLFGETLTPLQVTGAAVTLGAIYFGSVRR